MARLLFDFTESKSKRKGERPDIYGVLPCAKKYGSRLL